MTEAVFLLFFFNDTATTEIYTLSLHDALPIWRTPSTADPQVPSSSTDGPERRVGHPIRTRGQPDRDHRTARRRPQLRGPVDRKSTRLNSSHANISYAVFCLKKKKSINQPFMPC